MRRSLQDLEQRTDFVRRHLGPGPDQQRAMGDTLPVWCPFHIFMVDVIGREISGDAGKQVDIALTYRFREGDVVT